MGQRLQLKRYLIGIYAFLVLGVSVFLVVHLIDGRDMPAIYDDKDAPSEVDHKQSPKTIDEDTQKILSEMRRRVTIQLPAGIGSKPPKETGRTGLGGAQAADIKVDQGRSGDHKIEKGWRTHVSPLQPKTDKPKLIIVIDDLGLDQQASRRLAGLTGPFTLAYLPYADDLPFQTALVKDAGHELLVHLPMEPMNKQADPGYNAMLSGLTDAEFEKRLQWNLSRFDGFIGVNNHMGSRMTADGPSMARVLGQLHAQDYVFLDSLTTNKSYGRVLSRRLDVPFMARDIFLDNNRDKDAILEQLNKAIRIANQRGYAIAIGHPYQETLDILEYLSENRDQLPYELAPLSALFLQME